MQLPYSGAEKLDGCKGVRRKSVFRPSSSRAAHKNEIALPSIPCLGVFYCHRVPYIVCTSTRSGPFEQAGSSCRCCMPTPYACAPAGPSPHLQAQAAPAQRRSRAAATPRPGPTACARFTLTLCRARPPEPRAGPKISKQSVGVSTMLAGWPLLLGGAACTRPRWGCTAAPDAGLGLESWLMHGPSAPACVSAQLLSGACSGWNLKTPLRQNPTKLTLR